MERKKKSVSGFTLAELLIVVAIIAVLVAIAIPIFTSQLEKSREAVDLSDVRSAYAEVMMAAITGDTTASYTKDAKQTIYKSQGNVYSITVQPLKQKQDGWQTAQPITIGGVSSNAGEPYWKGVPGANGYCIITYHPAASGADEFVSFEWSGGNSGTSGGTSGGDGGTGDGGGDSGNSGGEDSSDNDSSPIESLDGKYGEFWSESTKYPTNDRNYERGKLYAYKGKLYVCKVPGYYGYNEWYKNEPDGNVTQQFPEITKKSLENPLTNADLSSNNTFTTIKYGDIYRDENGQYFIYVASSVTTNADLPSENTYRDYTDKWTPIYFK